MNRKRAKTCGAQCYIDAILTEPINRRRSSHTHFLRFLVFIFFYTYAAFASRIRRITMNDMKLKWLATHCSWNRSEKYSRHLVTDYFWETCANFMSRQRILLHKTQDENKEKYDPEIWRVPRPNGISRVFCVYSRAIVIINCNCVRNKYVNMPAYLSQQTTERDWSAEKKRSRRK